MFRKMCRCDFWLGKMSKIKKCEDCDGDCVSPDNYGWQEYRLGVRMCLRGVDVDEWPARTEAMLTPEMEIPFERPPLRKRKSDQ